MPDFPEPGIVFKDITPLLASPDARRVAVELMAEPHMDREIDAVFGIEARGFLFGTAVADVLDVAFVPVRKPGKLPRDVVGVDYALEYGTARLEVHTDAVEAGSRVLVVDDVLATGGTAVAALQLIDQLDATAVGVAALIELTALGARSAIDAHAPSLAVTAPIAVG